MALMISHGKPILNRTVCLTLSVFSQTWLGKVVHLEKYVGDTCRDELSLWIAQSARHGLNMKSLFIRTVAYIQLFACCTQLSIVDGELGNYICQSGFVQNSLHQNLLSLAISFTHEYEMLVHWVDGVREVITHPEDFGHVAGIALSTVISDRKSVV